MYWLRQNSVVVDMVCDVFTFQILLRRTCMGVFVHPICDTIPVTFLCAKVKPSMKSTADYQVWVLTTKDTRSQPGGSIHSAYCNCFDW